MRRNSPLLQPTYTCSNDFCDHSPALLIRHGNFCDALLVSLSPAFAARDLVQECNFGLKISPSYGFAARPSRPELRCLRPLDLCAMQKALVNNFSNRFSFSLDYPKHSFNQKCCPFVGDLFENTLLRERKRGLA